MEHCRQFEANVCDVGGDGVSDTIEFILINCVMTRTLSRNRIAAALGEITCATANPCPCSQFIDGKKTQEIENEPRNMFNTHEEPPGVAARQARTANNPTQPSPIMQQMQHDKVGCFDCTGQDTCPMQRKETKNKRRSFMCFQGHHGLAEV